MNDTKKKKTEETFNNIFKDTSKVYRQIVMSMFAKDGQEFILKNVDKEVFQEEFREDFKRSFYANSDLVVSRNDKTVTINIGRYINLLLDVDNLSTLITS